MSVSISCIMAHVLALCGTFAQVAVAQEEPRTYQGRSLAEWGERIKSRPLDALGSDEDVRGLMSIMLDESAPWPDRRQSALTLARIGAPASAAIPGLKKLLLDECRRDTQTLLWVLKSSAYFGPLAAELTPEIAQLAGDRNESYLNRLAAMEALALVGKNRAESISTLVGVLKESPGETQEELEIRLGAVDSLWYLGPGASSALPELLQQTRSEWSPLRLGTAQTIGTIGPAAEVALPTLVDMVLFDPAGEVREAAVDSLGRLGSPGVKALTHLLQDQEVEVRRLAVRGLKGNPSPAALAALVSAFQDTHAPVRVDATAAVAERDAGNLVSLETLVTLLTDDDRHVRLTAYRALQKAHERLGFQEERLREIAESSSLPEQSRGAAARLLTQLEETLSRHANPKNETRESL